MNEEIENYAKSLVKHGLYTNIDQARLESIRWHGKAERGLQEPLLCSHHPDIEITISHTDEGMIIEHKLP